MGEYLLRNPLFITMCFNQEGGVNKGWYNNHSLEYTTKIIDEVKRLSVGRDVKINYKRAYIPKPNGSMPPLGLPSRA